MMSTNTEALATSVYNPNIDSRTLALYQLMTNKPTDEDLLASYRTIVLNYPTRNLYEGVLVNPRACEIDTNSTLVEQIKSQLQEQYQGIANQGTPTAADPSKPGSVDYTPTAEQVATLEEWRNTYPQVQNDLDTVKQTLGDYRDHTDRLVSNFGTFSNLTQTNIGNTVASTTSTAGTSSAPSLDVSSLGNLTGNAGSLGSNPCIGFGDIFGSLFSAGQKMMDQMSKALMGLMGAIGNPMALIQQAMGAVMGMANQIMSKLMGELNKLASSIMNMMRMGLAQLMSFMPNDPCLKSIIGGLLSSGAKSALGGIL